MRVYLKKKKRKKNSQFQVSHFNLDKLKVKLKLSKTKARVLALGLRHVTGSRKAVASGYAEHLVQTSRDQEKFFTTAEIKVKNSSKKSQEEICKDVVHVRDLQNYFDYIREGSDILIKLCTDFAQTLHRETK